MKSTKIAALTLVALTLGINYELFVAGDAKKDIVAQTGAEFTATKDRAVFISLADLSHFTRRLALRLALVLSSQCFALELPDREACPTSSFRKRSANKKIAQNVSSVGRFWALQV